MKIYFSFFVYLIRKFLSCLKFNFEKLISLDFSIPHSSGFSSHHQQWDNTLFILELWLRWMIFNRIDTRSLSILHQSNFQRKHVHLALGSDVESIWQSWQSWQRGKQQYQIDFDRKTKNYSELSSKGKDKRVENQFAGILKDKTIQIFSSTRKQFYIRL